MKTLVIHPNDPSTDFLSVIYADKDWTVIRENCSRKHLTEQIKSHDRVVMLGHGTEYGLIGHNRLMIDSNWVYLLRDKECVYIWCNADVFFRQYELKGFYTGMIISEYEEAIMFSVYCNYTDIGESNILFADSIKQAIDSPSDMALNVKNIYDSPTNAVIHFNKHNIYYK